MVLHNEGLREVHAILVPTSAINGPDTLKAQEHKQSDKIADHIQVQPQENNALNAPPKPSGSSFSATNNAEFIPHLFYSLHQIRKEPNNSGHHLETATGFIRHRLKTCKSLIENNEDCKKLLGKSTQEWHEYLKNREKELQVKRNVLQDLAGKLSATNEIK